MSWTKESLAELVREKLAGVKVIVVANREPYIHNRGEDDEIKLLRPAGGLTTALDPVMKVCGGTWIGHGSGTADVETADAHGRLAVPPDDPKYTLRRVWLTKQEEEGYYYGAANDALWPLCHIAYRRPRFDRPDWEIYRAMNRRFADAVIEEAGPGPALVFVQDYHFALLPRMVKQDRPDLTVAQFWHIPFPAPETFRICPWGEEILEGLLGNDLLGFQIQYHANNFFDAVDRFLEAKIDREHFRVHRSGQATRVMPYPISVDPGDTPPSDPAGEARLRRDMHKRLRIGKLPIIVGVDRADYTKGIPERLAAVDRMLRLHPELKRKFVFVQIGAPSRVHLAAYRELGDQIERLAEEINWRHGEVGWQPIVLRAEHFDHTDVIRLLRMAQVCVVSSLQDGMNLVAKEFIAARDDGRGVLVLSKFTGAARELPDTLLVNPYATDAFADTLRDALLMPVEEQERRMRRQRAHVEQNNIFKWAGTLLGDAARELESRP